MRVPVGVRACSTGHLWCCTSGLASVTFATQAEILMIFGSHDKNHSHSLSESLSSMSTSLLTTGSLMLAQDSTAMSVGTVSLPDDSFRASAVLAALAGTSALRGSSASALC